MGYEYDDKPIDLRTAESKAIEWLELASELGCQRGFIGELALSIIAQGRREGNPPSEIAEELEAALVGFAEAAASFVEEARAEVDLRA